MMKRNLIFSLLSLMAILTMLAGCAQASQAPTPTQQIINPPVLSTNTPAGAAVATDTAAPAATNTVASAATNTAAPVSPAAGNSPLVINGVTMPFNRNQVFVMDQVNFAVFDKFNPFIPNGVEFAAGWWQISSEYLFYVNYATGKVEPRLGDSWEYNSDYTQMTIHTHKGATWNDGQPFTANDVAFTMNLCMKDATLASCPGSNDLSTWTSVTATDDYTVVFKFNQPRPRTHEIFWVKICTGQIIVPQHIWQNQDVKTFVNNPPVTTGPYMLDKTYPDQKIFVWKKNPNYWNSAALTAAAPQYVIYRSYTGTADEYLAEIQSNVNDSFGMDYQTYITKKDTIPQISLVAYVDPCPRGAYFNTAKAPFDNAEFRRALSMLMNRPKWAANIWQPASQAATAPWAIYKNLDPFINPKSDAAWGTYDYNPTKAKANFAELGYTTDSSGKLIGKDGKQVSIQVGTPTGVTDKEYAMAQDWIQDLNAVGIAATLQHFEQPVWFQKTATGDFDAGVWWLCGATVDPLELYQTYISANAVPIGSQSTKGNDVRLKDPELDAVVAKIAAITPDDPSAMALYQQAYDIFVRDAAAVPLIQTYYTTNYNTTFWDNTPSSSNLYTVPFNWWAQIEDVLFTIKAK
jgi:peptide/nickel transport system substrate-binding protein